MADVSMYVHAITLDIESNSPILILKEVGGDRTLSIWIGLLEATAIATEMEKIQFARPMTHDLLVNLLKVMGIEITKVEVSDLKDNTYYAFITLKQGDHIASVDARPSDAVAIALRADAQIFVNDSVLKETQSPKQGLIMEADFPEEKDKWTKILEELDPKTFKYKM
ncbi:MAG: bifunctional nuclease family protein [Nitrospiraceae bacterium]|nr:bifunctional nuclease family protein [Nitrospiraceae bacterium]